MEFSKGFPIIQDSTGGRRRYSEADQTHGISIGRGWSIHASGYTNVQMKSSESLCYFIVSNAIRFWTVRDNEMKVLEGRISRGLKRITRT